MIHLSFHHYAKGLPPFVQPSTTKPFQQISASQAPVPMTNQHQFEFAMAPYAKVYPFGEKSLPIADLFDINQQNNLSFVADYLLVRNIPIEKGTLRKSLKWSELFFKALEGEKTTEIFVWQRENRSA